MTGQQSQRVTRQSPSEHPNITRKDKEEHKPSEKSRRAQIILFSPLSRSEVE